MIYFLNMKPANYASLEEPTTLSDVTRRCIEILAQNLPDGWSITPGPHVVTDGSRPDADGVLVLLSPDHIEATLILEAKRTLDRRDVPGVAAHLHAHTAVSPNAWGVVVARYLSSSVRKELSEHGLSYVDATGNERLIVPRPGLFVSNRGADKDPWRGRGRPRGTLKGAPAARVVRALADFREPWKIRDLIECSGASTGATYRVVEYLEREGLLQRDERGLLVLNDWRDLLLQWSKDYGFTQSNRITRYIEPRGLPALMEKAGATNSFRYAVSGSLAAAEWAPYAPTKMAQIYVDDVDQAAEHWGLRPTDAGANILLAEPETDVVFDRAMRNAAGVLTVTPTQAAVDLLTGPGRNPSEAEELLKWMERNEASWRL